MPDLLRFAFCLALIAPLAAASVSACSSEDAQVTTHCTPGETQSCTGTDAAGICTGAQICATDGKSWGACDCGGAGTGGSGGTGDSGAPDASGGSAGSGGASGSNGGASGSAGSAGGSAGSDAGPDAAPPKQPGPLDDDCPPTIDLNCSDQCTPTDTATCTQLTCLDVQQTPPIVEVTKFPFTLRLPANPGLHCSCAQYSTPTYGVVLKMKVADNYAVRVGKPWHVTSAYHAACAAPYGYKGCMYGSTTGYVAIGTADPNAPSVNVTIEEVVHVGCFDDWYWK